MNDYNEGFQAGLKAAQAVAKEWSDGKWKVESQRSRFSIYDVQRYVEHAAHGISEDIRLLGG